MKRCLKSPTVVIPTDVGDEGRKRPYHFCYMDYVKALESQDLAVIILPIQSQQQLSHIMELADGLLIPGGDDLICENKLTEEVFVSPERQSADTFILSKALEMDIPILGICYGMQLINNQLGGSHVRHMKNASKHVDGAIHGLKLAPEARDFPEKIWQQASYHHQCVDRLGEGLKGIIYSDDGMIEGFSHCEKSFVMGFQWHVEKCETLTDTFILERFASSVKNGRKAKSS